MTDDESDAMDTWGEAAEETRDTTDPTPSNADATPDLQAAVRDAYAAIDDGDAHENLTIRDANLAALVRGLDDADELARVADAANDRLDRDADANADTRAGVLKAVLRVGFDAVAADAVETAKDAKREHDLSKVESDAEDF